jgi:branched-chain amino acid transport system substrate-binding protein
VLQDPTAIGYLGDFNSGASAVSIPLLNRLGIPQISPGSSAVGLTTRGPGWAPGEPQKYYPSGVRTFARVVPTDAYEAVALVRAEQAYGCHTTFVLEDAEVDGEDAALTFVVTAKAAGMHGIPVQAFQRGALDYTGLARTVAASGTRCVLISAIDERSSVRLTRQLARAVPKAMIFTTSGLADAAYMDPSRGGLPAALDDRVVMAYPTLPTDPGRGPAHAFRADYTRHFGAPQPAAIFGYQAMSLLLGAIARATDDGRREPERSTVRAELFSDREVHGVLGSFRIDPAGDISLTRYAIYTVRSARLVPWSGMSG